jgi:hypothetical protein
LSKTSNPVALICASIDDFAGLLVEPCGEANGSLLTDTIGGGEDLCRTPS